MQRHELLALLQEQVYNIPLNKWGLGEAKTVSHLFSEVQSGEARLSEWSGKLLRSVKGAVVTVYYTDGNRTWRLEESKQVFNDGRERKRDLDASVGEKLLPGETTEQGAYRALCEELGITEKLPLVSKPQIIKGPVPSQSYPGLLTEYVIDAYEVFIPESLYKSEGYVEEQKDQKNYFVWVEVSCKKTPHVAAICICPAAGEPMQQVSEVKAIAGQGLEGDRYTTGEGSFNKGKQGVRQVTLMNSIFFEGSGFEFKDSRRNLFVEGVELMWLIGREFQIGTARFRGVKYCDPCTRPSRLSGNAKSFKEAFFDRGGLIAEVIEGGVIKIGDAIVTPPKGY